MAVGSHSVPSLPVSPILPLPNGRAHADALASRAVCGPASITGLCVGFAAGF